MNDADIKSIVEGRPVVGNPQVIKLLEMALADAKQGRISGIGIMREHAGQVAASLAGQLTPGLYLCCDMAKETIKNQLMGGPGRGSSIMRPM